MKTRILCYSSGIAGRDPLAAAGPTQLMRRLQQQHPQYEIHRNLTCVSDLSGKAAMGEIMQLNTHLAQLTKDAITDQNHFLTLSGDHSSAIGTWSGAFNALATVNKSLGLIWLDAHMDCHTFETSPSQNIHGMPLAALLGYGDEQLQSITAPSPALQPNHVILIGIRSYEPEEKALLDRLNVKIYYIDEVLQRGLQPILQESLDTLDRRVDGIGITIDIDAVDPLDAPAVSTPEKNGISANDLITSLPLVCSHPKWIGTELTEFLPYKDQNKKTESLALTLIKTLLTVESNSTIK